MLPRLIRIQLAIFTVIAIVTVSYGALRYVELPRLLGFGTYQLTAGFVDGARLYPNALVTYRGLDVGKVERLAITEDGVDVILRIDDDIEIPDDVRAEAHSVSAVGEQYVELLPQRDTGPYLQPGDRIERSATSVPVEIGTVLEQVDALTSTLPSDDLNIAIDELHAGFSGNGDDLQRLIDSSRLLLGAAHADLEPTQQLIADLEPVLETQTEVSEPLRALTRDLASFTDQLRADDPQLRQVLEEGPGFAREVEGLFQDLRPTLPLLLANLVSVGEVVVTYLPGVQQVLVVYPAVIDSFHTALGPFPEREQAKIDFNLNVHDPPVCTDGFIPVSERRSPAELSAAPIPTDIHCKVAPDDPRDVRGARNLECPNDPDRRGARPDACGLDFTRAPVFPGRVSEGAVSSAPYTSAGRFQGPDGLYYVLGDAGGAPSAESTWQDLLLAPLNIDS